MRGMKKSLLAFFLVICMLLPALSACTSKQVQTAGQIAQILLSEDSDQAESGGSYDEVEVTEAAGDTQAADNYNEVEVTEARADKEITITEDGWYDTKDEVALYIHTFGKLPGNYISKRDAEDMGWISTKGNLWKIAPGKSIGGSRFGNYEGELPDAKGRKYFECDIDYDGGKRNAKRIVYSNDGLIFYTEDHYESFEQLY